MVLVFAFLFLSPYIAKGMKLLKSIIGFDTVVESTMSIIKSEDVMFLVMKRITSQIIVEKTDFNVFLGKREGVISCLVNMNYGINLRKINENSFQRVGAELYIKVPEPEEFDFAIDPNYRFFGKESGWNIIMDNIIDKNLEVETRSLIKEQAYAFFKNHDMIPSKNTMLERLNRYSQIISDNIGLEVEFN